MASAPRSLPSLPSLVLLLKIRETPQATWYRARQSRLGRDVLLKLRPAAGDPAAPRRVKEEMLLLSKLRLDAIVAAIDVGEADGWLYQVVEMPPGEPLSRLCKEKGRPWEPGEALAIASRLAQAIAEAHRLGIVFRRLHPEDVFLAPDGRVKIVSLEWASGPGFSPPLPPDGSWLAPEVAGGGAATGAADIHALGLILAWLLTGREPPSSGIRRADEKAAEALLVRGIGEEARTMVAGFLDPDPARRPSSAEAAREAIERVRARLERRGHPARAVVTLCALVLLAAGAGVLGLFLPQEKPSTSGERLPGEPELAFPVEPMEAEPPVDLAAAAEKPSRDSPPPPPPSREVPPEKAPERTTVKVVEKSAEGSPQESPAIAPDKSSKERAEVEEIIARDLPPLLRERTFGAAVSLLDRLAASHPSQSQMLNTARAEVDARRREAAEALSSVVEALLARGDLEEAERRTGEEAVRLAPPLDTEVRARLEGRIAERRRELAMARDAREAIEAGIDRAIAGKTPVRSRILDPDGEAAEEPQELMIDGRDGSSLAAHRRGSTLPLKLGLLDLEPAALRALAEGPEAPPRSGQGHASTPSAGPRSGDRSSAPSALNEGLLLLLLESGRPGHAARLLEDPAFTPLDRAALAPRLEAGRSNRLGASAVELSRRLRELEGRQAPEEAWTALRNDARRTIARHHRSPYYAGRRGETEEVFLASTRAVLRARVPGSLFSGHVLKDRRDGMCRIVYDFREAAHREDWTAVGEDSGVGATGEGIRLTGSMRLLSGNLFRDRMRVMALIPARAHRGDPHLAIFLGSRVKQEGMALAFVLGYRSADKLLEVPSEPKPLEVPAPANAIFACRSLLPAPGEAIAAAQAGRLQGPLLLQAEAAAGSLSFSLNHRPLLPGPMEAAAARSFARLAAPGSGERLWGSIVVATEDPGLLIERIEVNGHLEEAWVEERIDRLARAELAHLAAVPR